MPTKRDVIAGKASVVFGADISPLRRAFGEVETRLQQTGRRLKEISTQFVQIGAVSGFALGKAIEVGVKYEDQISTIQGLLQGTGEDINNIEKVVRKLGSTTSFTSAQVAGAFVQLKRGGLTASQAVDSLQTSLDLSRAGAIDLAQASRIIASAIKAFNLEGTDAVKVSNLLVQVSNNAGTSVEELGEAFKFVALNGKASGESIETIVKALGLLGDSALRGGNAGRALSRALERLANTEAIDKMRKLGVNINNIDPNTGKQEDFIKILFRLRDAIKGFDNRRQSAILNEIFDVQGKRAVQAIISRTSDEVERLDGAISDMDGVARSFAENLDKNVGGSFRKLNSAIQFFSEELTKSLAGPIETISVALRGLAVTVAEFVRENQTLTQVIIVTGVGITALATVTLGLGVALLAIGGGIGLAVKGFRNLGVILGILNGGPLKDTSAFLKQQSILVRVLRYAWKKTWKLIGLLLIPTLKYLKTLLLGIATIIKTVVIKSIVTLGVAVTGFIGIAVGALGFTIWDAVRDKSKDATRSIEEQIKITNALKKAQRGERLDKKEEDLLNDPEKSSIDEKLQFEKIKRSRRTLLRFISGLAKGNDPNALSTLSEQIFARGDAGEGAIATLTETRLMRKNALEAISKTSDEQEKKTLNKTLTAIGEIEDAIKKVRFNKGLIQGILTKEDFNRIKQAIVEFAKLNKIGKSLGTEENKQARLDRIEDLKFEKSAVEALLKTVGDDKRTATLARFGEVSVALQKAKREFEIFKNSVGGPQRLTQLESLQKFLTDLPKRIGKGVPKEAVRPLRTYARDLIAIIQAEVKANKLTIPVTTKQGPKSLADIESGLAKIRKEKREVELRFNAERFTATAQKAIDDINFQEAFAKGVSTDRLSEGFRNIKIEEVFSRLIKNGEGKLQLNNLIDGDSFSDGQILSGLLAGLKTELKGQEFNSTVVEFIKQFERKLRDAKLKAELTLDPDNITGVTELQDVLRKRLEIALSRSGGKENAETQSIRRVLGETQSETIKDLQKRLKTAITNINFDELKKKLEKDVALAEKGILPDSGTDVVGTFSSRASLDSGRQQAFALWRQQLKTQKKIADNTAKGGVLGSR